MTSDERLVELLTEIRDLQREQVARYAEASRRQDASIEAQREAIELYRSTIRRVFRLVLPVVVAILFLILLLARLT